MKRWLFVIAGLCAVAALWYLAAPHLARSLIVERPLERADAIIVLSGSAAYRERTRRAAQLFREGVSKRILLTDDGERASWSRTEQRNPAFYELAKRELIAGGVPDSAISLLPGTVAGTDHEAFAVAAELRERPAASLLIVTSPYHTSRSVRTFERILGDLDVRIGIVHTAFGHRVPDPANWWTSLAGWRSVGGEYVKSAVYWVYY